MKPGFTVGEPGCRNAPLPFEKYVAWARYPTLNITCDTLEIQKTTKTQMYIEELCRLIIKRVRSVNNSQVRSAFAANKQRLFKVPSSVPCDSFCVANSFEHCFVGSSSK